MVSRELYLRKVRPFIGTDVVKAITGMRRSGKSALLELIQAELRQRQSVARAGGGARRDPERSRPVALRALAAGENRHVPLDASFSFSRVELAPGETFEVPNRPFVADACCRAGLPAWLKVCAVLRDCVK